MSSWYVFYFILFLSLIIFVLECNFCILTSSWQLYYSKLFYEVTKNHNNVINGFTVFRIQLMLVSRMISHDDKLSFF